MDIQISHIENELTILAYNDKEKYRITLFDPRIENFEPRKSVSEISDIENLSYSLRIEEEQSDKWITIISSSDEFGAGLLQFPSIAKKALNAEIKKEGIVNVNDDGVDIEKYYYYSTHTFCDYNDYFEVHKTLFEGFGTYLLYNLIICMGSKAVKINRIYESDMESIVKSILGFINSAIESYMRLRDKHKIRFRELYVPTEKAVWVKNYSEENECYTGAYFDFFRLNEFLEGIKILEKRDGKEVVELYEACKITEITNDSITVIGNSYGGNYKLTVPYTKIVDLWDDFNYRKPYKSMNIDQIVEDLNSVLSPSQIQEFINSDYSELFEKYWISVKNHYCLYDEAHEYPNKYNPSKDIDRKKAAAFVKETAIEIIQLLRTHIYPF